MSETVSNPHGWAAEGFEPVFRAFQDGFFQGVDKGAALAIYHKGNLVVNAWGGIADEAVKRPWKEDTYGHFWSCTKYMSAVVIAHLVERGLLDYDEKVCKYWPEFAQNGKETITLNCLLSHSAGVSVSREEYKMAWLRDEPHKLSAFLASQSPLWKPGTNHGYSGFLFGLHLNEIVRRVDIKARTLSQYFKEEIAEPFGLNLHIGCPKSLFYKCCRTVWRRISDEEIAKSLENYQGDWELFHLQRRPTDFLKYSLDDPDFAAIGCGSTHGAGSAKTAAKFAGIMGNGGVLDGKVMLTRASIDKLQKPMTHGIDCISSTDTTFGRGTAMASAHQGNKSWVVFGYSGYGGQIILTDPHYKMGFAFCTNYMEPFANFKNNRWRRLLEAFYQCVSHLDGNSHNVVLKEQFGEQEIIPKSNL